jgi:hypothetical protein
VAFCRTSVKPKLMPHRHQCEVRQHRAAGDQYPTLLEATTFLAQRDNRRSAAVGAVERVTLQVHLSHASHIPGIAWHVIAPVTERLFGHENHWFAYSEAKLRHGAEYAVGVTRNNHRQLLRVRIQSMAHDG